MRIHGAALATDGRARPFAARHRRPRVLRPTATATNRAHAAPAYGASYAGTTEFWVRVSAKGVAQLAKANTAAEQDTVTVAAALDHAARRLTSAGLATPRLDAEVLLRHVMGVDRTALFLRTRETLPTNDLEALGILVAQRVAGQPVAYLTGQKEFMGLPLAVGPGVLVPRPETELLVEWALGWLPRRPEATIVDIGTGTGAIAVALAAHLPTTWRGRLIAADVSAEALRYARKNMAAHTGSRRVALIRGNLLSWLRGPVDLLLANLPYLGPDQIVANPDLHAEPELALDGGADGLALVRRLLADAPRVMMAGGAIGLEVDPANAAAAAAAGRAAFPGGTVEVQSDLAGLDRLVIIQTEQVSGGHA